MPEIQLIARYSISPAEEERFFALLEPLAEATRAEPGNLAFGVYRCHERPREIVLLERYASAEAVEAHRASEHFEQLLQGSILPLLESRVVESYEVG